MALSSSVAVLCETPNKSCAGYLRLLTAALQNLLHPPSCPFGEIFKRNCGHNLLRLLPDNRSSAYILQTAVHIGQSQHKTEARDGNFRFLPRAGIG